MNRDLAISLMQRLVRVAVTCVNLAGRVSGVSVVRNGLVPSIGMTPKKETDVPEPWRIRILRRRLTHLFLPAAILVLDYVTGSSVEFPIAFVIPVALASWFCTSRIGYTLAVIMPVIRLGFWYLWDNPVALFPAIINLLIRVIVLLLIAYLTSKAARLTREVKVLQGLLSVCSFCKKIRDKEDAWQPMEIYISQRTDADFTHSICPECTQIHFGAILNRPRDG